MEIKEGERLIKAVQGRKVSLAKKISSTNTLLLLSSTSNSTTTLTASVQDNQVPTCAQPKSTSTQSRRNGPKTSLKQQLLKECGEVLFPTQATANKE